MIESAITSKGQTTLPKVVREALGVQTGDRVRYVIFDDEVRILPVCPVNRLFGVLQHTGPAVTLEEMEQAIISGAIESDSA
jgi:AbrB family looped-hinge helix DNA binding protein